MWLRLDNTLLSNSPNTKCKLHSYSESIRYLLLSRYHLIEFIRCEEGHVKQYSVYNNLQIYYRVAADF